MAVATETCAICMDSQRRCCCIRKPLYVYCKCNVWIHRSCFQEWINRSGSRTCMVCHGPLTFCTPTIGYGQIVPIACFSICAVFLYIIILLGLVCGFHEFYPTVDRSIRSAVIFHSALQTMWFLTLLVYASLHVFLNMPDSSTTVCCAVYLTMIHLHLLNLWPIFQHWISQVFGLIGLVLEWLILSSMMLHSAKMQFKSQLIVVGHCQ
jgi:hypothetical protein